MAIDRKGNERIHFTARYIDRPIGVILLRVLALVQAICLIPILIRFLLLPPDFSAVGLWFIAIGISLISAPYALWQIIRHPPRRFWAGLMLVLAVSSVGVPLLIDRFQLQPLPAAPVALVSVFVVLIGSLWLLARPAFWTDRIWTGRRFNLALLLVLVVWIALVAAPLAFGLAVGFAPPMGNDRLGLSLDVLLIHGASLGLSGLILAAFALIFSPVGLWRNRRRIGLHAAQLVAALTLAAVLLMEAVMLSIMTVNTG